MFLKRMRILKWFLKEDEILFLLEFEEKKGTMNLPIVDLSPWGLHFKTFVLKPSFLISF